MRKLARRPSRRSVARVFRLLTGGTIADSAARARAKGLYEARRYVEALAVLDAALAKHPKDVRTRRVRSKVLARMGAFEERLAERRTIAELTGDEADRALVRRMEGRARELDPGWLPSLGGGTEPLEPRDGAVLHILKHSLPYHTNGYTVRSRYTLIAQRDAGLHPSVVTSLGHPRTDGVERFDAVEMVDGIPHHRLDLGPDHDDAGTPVDVALEHQTRLAADVVRAERPQIIHARSGFRGYETVIEGIALARRFDLPVVYELSSFIEGTWSDDPEWAEVGQVYELRVARENRCMADVDHVITIAETMRREIVERGIPAEKVTVIPNAVDAEAFAPRAKDPDLVRALGFEGKTVIGYISNVGAREGFDYLVEATAILVAAGVPVACLIVGDGPERPAIERLVADLRIGDAVAITGAVPHERIQDYYALIDVFVIPRRDDHAARWVTPLKPFEAMAMGKPLLVADLPALVEVTEPGERGLTFAVGDAADLAARARRLIEDPDMRRTFGEKARDWVVRERTWGANGARYRDLYAQVIERHRAGRTP